MSAVHAMMEREFAFSDAQFNAIRAAVRDYAGFQLSDTKRQLMHGHLRRPEYDDGAAVQRAGC